MLQWARRWTTSGVAERSEAGAIQPAEGGPQRKVPFVEPVERLARVGIAIQAAHLERLATDEGAQDARAPAVGAKAVRLDEEGAHEGEA